MTASVGPLGTRGSGALAIPAISKVVLAGVLLSAGCSSPAPTTPTGAAPVASLSVTIDTNATAAIPFLSVVRFDASASTGTGLSFHIDMGDGTTAQGPRAEHVYLQGNTVRTVEVTVTDSAGRTSRASGQVLIASITRGWFSISYSAAIQKNVSHWLTIESQRGTELSGTYYDDVGTKKAFSGLLLPNRGIILTLSDGSGEFVGLPPQGIDAKAQRLTLKAKGGWADGQTLEFVWPINSVAAR